jgi:hypothetical protein
MDGKALVLSLRFDRIIELHRARLSHLDLPPIPDRAISRPQWLRPRQRSCGSCDDAVTDATSAA